MEIKTKLVLLCQIIIYFSGDKVKGAPEGSGPILRLPQELLMIVLQHLGNFKDMQTVTTTSKLFAQNAHSDMIFLQLGVQELQQIRDKWGMPFTPNLKGELDSLLDVFKTFLKHEILTFPSATFILSWVLISHLPNVRITDWSAPGGCVDHATLFADLLIPFIRQNLVPYQNAEEYQSFKACLSRHAKFLTMSNHMGIMKYLNTYFNKQSRDNAGWMFAGYNLVLESSPHLEHRIPLRGIESMVLSCAGANAQYILYINSKASGNFEVKKRFIFNWKLFKGKDSDQKWIYFAVTAATQAVNILAENYPKYIKGEIDNFYHAQVVGAILELSSLKTPNFQNLVYDDVNLNLAMFEAAKKDQIVQKLGNWLKDQCKKSKTLETGLTQLMTALDKIQKRKDVSDVDAFHAVMNLELVEGNEKATKYFIELAKTIT